MELNKIYQGNCLEILKTFQDNTFDSIITDPPYELGFMGNEWDKKGIAFNVDLWKESLRVLKPGGHLLSFGGTRTYHRMACAIEDAGFEIRDMIEWVYGCGLPKSLNIGKQIDKIRGNERIEKDYYAPDGRKRWGGNSSFGVGKLPSGKGVHKISFGFSEWEGWGTALKPTHEPIVVARKPIEKGLNVTENVLKWGTGGLNIDESRIDTEKIMSKGSDKGKGFFSRGLVKKEHYGRFPANLIHDGSDEVKECFPFCRGEIGRKGRKPKEEKSGMFGLKPIVTDYGFIDEGSASRFFKECNYTDEDLEGVSIFYCSKASTSERNKGCKELEERDGNIRAGISSMQNNTKPKKNFHPTVKPIKLMEYLVKLVTRKGGLVLDPFAGSGSTLIACAKNGYNFVGIELIEDYVKIAEKRLQPYLSQSKLEKYSL